MCSVALYLKKIGVRSCSSFFDWNDSCLRDNIRIVDSNFRDVLNPCFFKQLYPEHPHIVTNTKFNLSYVHTFNPKRSLNNQIESVKKNVNKRINNFINSLNDNCLLVYYSRTTDENNWIKDNQHLIECFCSKHNCDILFVLNNDIDGEFLFPKFVIPQNNIHKPFGGDVSYLFEETNELDEYILSRYDENKRKQNLAFKHKKSIFKKIISRFESRKKNRLKV